jgi:hypothetical protein
LKEFPATNVMSAESKKKIIEKWKTVIPSLGL